MRVSVFPDGLGGIVPAMSQTISGVLRAPVDTRLMAAIRQVESRGNGHAMRFEPVLYANNPQWVKNQEPLIAKVHGCSWGTAQQIACTSYGFYQLLGANIYALGLGLDVVSFMTDPMDYNGSIAGGGQATLFQKFISGHGFSASEDVAKWDDARFAAFATFYNGPGNVADYAAAMKKAAGL